MKTCTRCGETRPVTEFYGNRLMPDGLLNQCKACVKASQRAYRLGPGRENTLRLSREYMAANKDQKRAYDAAYRVANRERIRSAKRAGHVRRVNALRDEVFGHYGRSCACCGTTDRLTIDHIAGGGSEHRQQIGLGATAGTAFYRWLVSNGLPDGYQTLCQSCNSSKRNGERCRLAHHAKL